MGDSKARSVMEPAKRRKIDGEAKEGEKEVTVDGISKDEKVNQESNTTSQSAAAEVPPTGPDTVPAEKVRILEDGKAGEEPATEHDMKDDTGATNAVGEQSQQQPNVFDADQSDSAPSTSEDGIKKQQSDRAGHDKPSTADEDNQKEEKAGMDQTATEALNTTEEQNKQQTNIIGQDQSSSEPSKTEEQQKEKQHTTGSLEAGEHAREAKEEDELAKEQQQQVGAGDGKSGNQQTHPFTNSNMGPMHPMNANPNNMMMMGGGGVPYNPMGPGAMGGFGGGYPNFMGGPVYFNGGPPGGRYGMPPMQMQQYWGGMVPPGPGQFSMGGPPPHGGMHQYPPYPGYHPHELAEYPHPGGGGVDPYYGQSFPAPASGGGSNSPQQKQSQRSQEQNAKATTMGVLTGRDPQLLYMTCDDESLSGYQCLVRRQIELFEARSEDVESNAQGRNKPIVLGQVGIRCRHCTNMPPRHRARASVYYPAKLMGLYQAAQNMATIHLCQHCQTIPSSVRSELLTLRERKSSAGGGKKYWGDGARVLGVYESEDGLRFEAASH